MDERKKLAEVAVEEARRVKPSAFLQVCTVALSAKDTVELTRHAQDIGADICYLQNPVMEAHGGPGMLEFFRYVADRTDIALGMFNSPSSGYEMTPAEVARVAEEIPAMCAIKDPADDRRSRHRRVEDGAREARHVGRQRRPHGVVPRRLRPARTAGTLHPGRHGVPDRDAERQAVHELVQPRARGQARRGPELLLQRERRRPRRPRAHLHTSFRSGPAT